MFKPEEASVPDKQYVENTSITKLPVGSPNGIIRRVTSITLNPHTPDSRRTPAAQPAIYKHGTPRRYSLSDTNSPMVRPHSTPYTTNSPGPLLAPLSYRDNVSMYEETKSSGLARRIVSYREEAEQEQHPTHQKKYNSPGLFPIVHLFKKSATPPPVKRNVKVKLASPEYLRSFSPQRSKVLDEITRPRLYRQLSLPGHAHNGETSTKSVLDALKEISRKRIHSSEEHESLEEIGKRQKTDLCNGNAEGSSKRGRADSPLSDQTDSPTSKQTQKKFCVYDEFAASKSSSDFSFLAKSEPLRSKRKTTYTSTESLVQPKQVKVANAETQTFVPVIEKKSVPAEQNEEPKKLKKKKDYPLKVFDDAPLHRIRKNRLAALMGTMLGKDITLPLDGEPDTYQIDLIGRSSETTVSTELPSEKSNTDVVDRSALKSILSPTKPAQEAAKPEKHVHFNVPATTANPITVLTSASTPVVTTTISEPPKQNATPVTPIAFPLPVNSAALNKSSPEKPTPTFSFGTPDKSNLPNSAVDGSLVAGFNFAKPAAAEAKPESPVKTATPPKVGGFKFDLKTPPVSVPASLTTTPSVPVSLTFPPVTSAIATTASIVTTTSSPASFSFGKPTETPVSSGFSFGAPSSTQENPSFGFGSGPKSDIFAASSAAEVKPLETKPVTVLPTLPAATTASFGFGSSQPAAATVTGFSFGTVTSQQQPPPAFGTLTTTTPAAPFSAASSTASVFGSFGAPADQTPVSKPQAPTFAFGGANSAFAMKPNATFGATTTSSAATPAFSSSLGSFGAATNPVTTTSPSVFGGFGATQTKPPAFGLNPAPTVTSAPSIFGAAPTTTTSATFGSAATPSTFKFPTITTTAAASAFSSAQPTFGQNLTSTSTAPVFGSSSGTSPAFKSNMFGAGTFGATSSAPPAFGSSTAPVSQNAPPSVFGGGTSAFTVPTTAATTTASSMFGAANTATPTFAFGASKPPPNPFGAGAAVTTTTGSSTFGSSSSFVSGVSAGGFGSSGGFGAAAAPAFGTPQKTATFGATSAPSFGQPMENKPTFSFGAGAPTPKSNPPPSFGSATSGASFGGPQPTATGFGSTNPSGFGTQQNNGAFNFGSSNATTAAPFAFGSGAPNKEVSKPTFNFTGNSNPPAFGAGPTPTFGTATNFSVQPQPQFPGAGGPPGGVFTIGSGSTPGPRPRAQIRAKRRT